MVPAGTAIVDTIIGSLNLFQMANQYHKQHAGNDLFQIDLVGMDNNPQTYNNLFTIAPTKSIDEISATDLIIVAGIVGNIDQQIERNRSFVEWMRNMRITSGSEIASLCRGAFLLAETGLLNGKSCATHWITHGKFQQRYPQVNLLPDKIINEDNGIYSSGGAYSFLNLIIYLIEKYYGREVAIKCSKVAEIEIDRFDQNQFMIFQGQKEHSDAAIGKVQEYIEKHYAENLSVEKLAGRAAISQRNFVRRFKRATNNTPIEYIQRVRIEAAKKMLESTTTTVQQTMYESGYQDDKSFRTIFKRYSGLTPLEYRKKYNREMALG